MTAKLSVCVEMIFRDLPLLERLNAVAAAGLPAYEFWRLDGKDVEALRQRQDELGIACAAFAGTGGVPLVDASRLAEYLDAVRNALAVARRLGCGVLLTTTGNRLADRPRAEQHAAVVAALREAAKPAEDAGVTLALEPLNVLVDHPGYFLTASSEGFDIVDEVASPAVKLLYDVYHQQVTEGNLTAALTANLAKIGHVHAADVPGRHEPGSGEINYRHVFGALAAAGYAGYVGLEYRPSGDPARSLEDVKALLT